MRSTDLIAVGYWRSDEEPSFPDPHDLGTEPRDAELVAQICNYLESGQSFLPWLGYSWCRFGCGIPESKMGSQCLIDGTWMWPEGLSHYVRVHQIPLPKRFIEHMAANSWRVPTDAAVPSLDEPGSEGLGNRLPVTYEFWKNWRPTPPSSN